MSFYYAMGYLVTDAVNSVKNFRYAIRDGEVWLLDERIPSLTDLKPGSEQFHIVTLPKVGGIAEFCASAQARSAAQKTLLDQDEENDNLIYISCTPWFDLTGCTNERDFDRDDNIPRHHMGQIWRGKLAARNWGCRWRSITASSTVSIWGNSTRNYRPTSTHYKEAF